MSAMTPMGLGPQSSATYENFADTIGQVTLEAVSKDLREMFGRVAFTVLVGSVDGHWRNHGFLRIDGVWRLRPLFDVNLTRAGSRVPSRRINDRDAPSNRDVRLFIEGRENLFWDRVCD
ncbi:HipA domain-containing protein [Cryobacterium serini]|uniref:HipA domain-containing protein n=2 Tax=Cryobacterium serini TaxID=1259201 RepID=A0A4R9BJG6_9MICO|nr:HipA domain-containing protein [Cryobacterium serini]